MHGKFSLIIIYYHGESKRIYCNLDLNCDKCPLTLNSQAHLLCILNNCFRVNLRVLTRNSYIMADLVHPSEEHSYQFASSCPSFPTIREESVKKCAYVWLVANNNLLRNPRCRKNLSSWITISNIPMFINYGNTEARTLVKCFPWSCNSFDQCIPWEWRGMKQ